ncbi:MAG: hypothetical protein ACXVPN_10590 [Bacteroidia bacterium]
MLDLKTALANISTKWKYKLDEVSPGVWRVDVALKMKDESWRYQFVYVWIVETRFQGKPAIYMNSRCGEYNSNLSLYNLLKESGYGNYSSVTVTTDKRVDGSPCETVIVQASLSQEHTTEALLDAVIFEVANGADIIEEKFFGGDTN